MNTPVLLWIFTITCRINGCSQCINEILKMYDTVLTVFFLKFHSAVVAVVAAN